MVHIYEYIIEICEFNNKSEEDITDIIKLERAKQNESRVRAADKRKENKSVDALHKIKRGLGLAKTIRGDDEVIGDEDGEELISAQGDLAEVEGAEGVVGEQGAAELAGNQLGMSAADEVEGVMDGYADLEEAAD